MSGKQMLLAVVCVAAAMPFGVFAQASDEVVADTSRPLTRVVEAFEQTCNCMITYEDVKWDLSQTVPSAVLRHHVTGRPAMIPNGVPFRFSVPPDLAHMSPAGVTRALRHVIDAYGSSQNPGKFRLVQGRIALHVLPSQPAISETPVSVAVEGVNSGVAVQTVLDEILRVTGQNIGVWHEPANLMTKPVRISASNEPAYDVLSRIVLNIAPGLSWRLLYDVNMKRYYLDIYRPGVPSSTVP